jgi:hypothetical protein
VGAQCGQMGTEYMVAGVLGGRLFLPHVVHKSWVKASVRVEGVGTFVC